MAFTIFWNTRVNPLAEGILRKGTEKHRLIISDSASVSVLAKGISDSGMEHADIAFGQPDPDDCIRSPRLKWIEVSSAGYTRYDTADFFGYLRERSVAFTNVSSVFADPCAQHVMAMMLAFGRQLLPSFRDQITDQSWHYDERRYHSRLLTGQTVVMLGYGAIGLRLSELLKPFGMTLYAVRRKPAVEADVTVVDFSSLDSLLAKADHVVNILPANDSTAGYCSAGFFSKCRPGARFYNVGRGSTVNQDAVAGALRSGILDAAYLDVTDVEPLPPENDLWRVPNCFITPHTAGGRHDQDEALVRHFLRNLAAFEAQQPLVDRVL
jgi:phosphoglycerate dehydrogenase-like enzyme